MFHDVKMLMCQSEFINVYGCEVAGMCVLCVTVMCYKKGAATCRCFDTLLSVASFPYITKAENVHICTQCTDLVIISCGFYGSSFIHDLGILKTDQPFK